jgi:hypothetical protein
MSGWEQPAALQSPRSSPPTPPSKNPREPNDGSPGQIEFAYPRDGRGLLLSRIPSRHLDGLPFFPRVEGGADTILERIIPLDSISSIQSLPRQGPEQESRTGLLPPPQPEAPGANPASPRIPRPAGIPTDLLESLGQTSLESPPEAPRLPSREAVVPLVSALTLRPALPTSWP